MALNEPQWHPEAILDAEFARNWYAERSPFAARGFLLAVDDAVNAVMQAPGRWPVRTHGCQQAVPGYDLATPRPAMMLRNRFALA